MVDRASDILYIGLRVDAQQMERSSLFSLSLVHGLLSGCASKFGSVPFLVVSSFKEYFLDKYGVKGHQEADVYI